MRAGIERVDGHDLRERGAAAGRVGAGIEQRDEGARRDDGGVIGGGQGFERGGGAGLVTFGLQQCGNPRLRTAVAGRQRHERGGAAVGGQGRVRLFLFEGAGERQLHREAARVGLGEGTQAVERLVGLEALGRHERATQRAEALSRKPSNVFCTSSAPEHARDGGLSVDIVGEDAHSSRAPLAEAGDDVFDSSDAS
jgi:hypothetical protein